MRPHVGFGVGNRLLALALALGVGVSPAAGQFLFTVGGDSSCSHSDLQQAINFAQAFGPQMDTIRVTKSKSYTDVRLNIDGHSVFIEGGFDSCAHNRPSGPTNLSGAGGVADSVIEIFGTNGSQQVILKNLRITGGENDADFGGGIEIDGSMHVTLDDVLVELNTSRFGGGVHIDGTNGATLTIEGAQILSNTALSQGGGIYCENGGTIYFNDGVIGFNVAQGQLLHGTPLGGGGGLFLDGCTLESRAGGIFQGVIFNSALTGNGNGGGIHSRNGSTVTLIGDENDPAVIDNNTAEGDGGGFYSFNHGLVARNARITNNSARRNGGGVFGGLVMERILGESCYSPDRCSVLSGNTAGTSSLGGQGGAVYGVAFIRGTYVENNRAFGPDGGPGVGSVFSTRNSGIEIEGSIVTGNSDASSIFHTGESVLSVAVAIRFSTVAANRDETAVVSAEPGRVVEIVSSIIWDGPGSSVVDPGGGASVSADCVIAHEIASLSGTYLSVQDPRFLDSGAGDYHLALSSPAIDACDDASYEPQFKDIDHEPRGFDHPEIANDFPGSVFDIGADEIGLDTFCPETLALENQALDGVYRAQSAITVGSGAVVQTGATAALRAADGVTLESNFKAEPGSTLKIQLSGAPCTL